MDELSDLIDKLPLREFAEKAYLEYSMYVVLDRALPSLGDGLKPVQRRIIYAMSELGLNDQSKHKKSARTVGDVIGKFHPHGDSACYEAMVLMAQNFSFRYPLIDGQGNWGSMDDPKSFAAMRYTEAKLTKFASVLLSELQKDTVEWLPNFDATLTEPVVLPAKLPNILLNGTSGIAVGLATDIPPHNITEVGNACIQILDNPKITIEELRCIILGPDFPTGGILVTPEKDLNDIYKTGNGTLKLRCSYGSFKNQIIISELPYQVSNSKVLEQIGSLMVLKKVPMISDIRDESDQHQAVRIVLDVKLKRHTAEQIMDHLFVNTDLEKTYKVNLNVIALDGLPSSKNLLELLKDWVDFRLSTVKRRLESRLAVINKRLHLLEGLRTVFLNLDEVIETIRSTDHPKSALIAKFELTDVQAEGILNIRLRQLAKLEELEIQKEIGTLTSEKKELIAVVKSKKKLRDFVKKEIKLEIETHGDERRTLLDEKSAAIQIASTDLVAPEPITLILSAKGWIRSAKGHTINLNQLNFRNDDSLFSTLETKTDKRVLIFDTVGKAFSLSSNLFPSARGFGEPLTKWLNLSEGGTFNGIFSLEKHGHILLASNLGYGFFSPFTDLLTKNKSGKTVINIPQNGYMLKPQVCSSLAKCKIAVVSNIGKLLIFWAKEMPIMTKGKGQKLISLKATGTQIGKEFTIGVAIINAGQSLKITAGDRFLTIKEKDQKVYQSSRAKRGQFLPKGFRKVSALTAL